MFTFGALCHLCGPEKEFGMLVKKDKEESKEEREEIEMRLIEIEENASGMNEKIDGKITQMNDKSKA